MKRYLRFFVFLFLFAGLPLFAQEGENAPIGRTEAFRKKVFDGGIPLPRETSYQQQGFGVGLGGGALFSSGTHCNTLAVWQGTLEYYYAQYLSAGFSARMYGGNVDDKYSMIYQRYHTHLRMHHLLNIGDWIQVPEKDVDGEVKKVTLTSVSISNWDTTTSVIPISMLHADHFINLQNMMLGKTYGRRMLKSFVFDTSWFCTLSAEAIRKIEADHSIDLHLTDEEIGKGILNAKVFRQYLYHWLMNHSHISQLPRLIVRWLEHEGNGMPLQVYAFIIDSTLAAFEWQQSQIMEHIIESAAWFNMQLFQEASAFDVSNSNIYLTKQPAPYRKEELQ